MRIAIATNSYPPRVGGLEYHIENLAQSLRRLGHDVWVLTISDTPGSRSEHGVRIYTGRSHFPIADVISLPNLGTTRALTHFLKKNSIDVVSTHTRFFPMSYVGLRAAHRAHIPVIHTEHGSGFVATPSPVIAIGSRVVDESMGRWVLAHADRVLGVSPQATAFAARLGARSPQVFYNAITPSSFEEPISDHPEHVVFIGRMVAGKGWDTFLQAVATLHREGKQIMGDMLGDGADLPRARQMCHELGLDEIVTIHGRVSQAQARKTLRGATLVNPTVLSEGFQTTLLEAIAERGRVVTFEVPGAQLLHAAGAPITICSHSTQESLVSSIESMLAKPLPLAPASLIDAWTWPSRAREYEQIAFEVISQFHAER